MRRKADDAGHIEMTILEGLLTICGYIFVWAAFDTCALDWLLFPNIKRGRRDAIQNACRSLGKEATFYDDMITCSALPGRAVCGVVWNMGRERRSSGARCPANSDFRNRDETRNFY